MDDICCSGLLVVFLVFGTLLFVYPLVRNTAQRDHVAKVRVVWQRAGREIEFGPVRADFYSEVPSRTHEGFDRVPGALGLADKQVMFVPIGDSTNTQIIPLDTIRWAGIHPIRVRSVQWHATRDALVVHFERNRLWYVAVWTGDDLEGMAQILRARGVPCDFTLYGPERPDLGPVRASRVEQDIYGQWHSLDAMRPPDAPLPNLLTAEGELYLAPDRLLFNRQHVVLLSQVRHMAVYRRGGVLDEFNPLCMDLLRIDYETNQRRRATVGFLLCDPHLVASRIAALTRVPFEVIEGRKKKHEEV